MLLFYYITFTFTVSVMVSHLSCNSARILSLLINCNSSHSRIKFWVTGIFVTQESCSNQKYAVSPDIQPFCFDKYFFYKLKLEAKIIQ